MSSGSPRAQDCERGGLDIEGNMVDITGNIVVPRQAVQQYISSMQQRHYGKSAQFRGECSAVYDASSKRISILISMNGDQDKELISTEEFTADSGFADPYPRQDESQRATPAQPHSTPHPHLSRASECSPSPSHFASAPDRPVSGRLSLAIPGTNNSSTYAYAEAAAASVRGDWLPEEAALGFDSNFHAAAADQLPNWYPQHNVPEQPGISYAHSPQRSCQPSTPAIRLTTDIPGAQPQSNFSASPMGSLPPNPYQQDQYSVPGHLSPRTPYPMPQEATENMPTPVSPVSAQANSPHDTAMGNDQHTARKRSHSEMSQQDADPTQQHAHSRSDSIASQQPMSPHGANDDFNPRGSRAFKRGNPPTNDAGKYICEHSDECVGQTFDRKCEWSKHMDKHDRPYRCMHPSCQKLQGFTYSGGLLRHEREVHSKHGGPKAPLMCPYTDCKRHLGKGFTRKENLNEHIRRVHPDKDQNSQTTTLTRGATDVTLGAEESATPASMGAMSEPMDPHDPALTSPAELGKRNRLIANDEPLGDAIYMERELKRIRQENHDLNQTLIANKQLYENKIHALEVENGRLSERLAARELESDDNIRTLQVEQQVRNQLSASNAAS